MKQFGKLGIELKSGILFSLSALILSLIAGLSGGVPGGVILMRALVITLVFFIAGYGIILILEKFVPEVYEMISSMGVSSEETLENLDLSSDAADIKSEESQEKMDPEFTEFTEKDYDRLDTIKGAGAGSSVQDSHLDDVLHTSSTKLGKHIIVENNLNSYEPKLMAQAVRTMMSKDKE